MRRVVAIGAATSLIMATPAHASWLSEITGVHVDLNGGGGPFIRIEPPKPQAIPEMLQNLPQDAAQFFLSPHGNALAAAIRHARAQARGSSSPLPPQIRQALAPYFPPNILDKARWKMRSNLGFALDNVVLGLGDQGAITLDDVIIFNDGTDPNSTDLTSLELWAHELTHVVQYENMGVETFAFIYSYDWNKLESQARSNASGVANRLAQGVQPSGYYAVGAYASPAQIGSQQLQPRQLQQAAMQFVPPARCVAWQTNQIGAVLQNVCTVPIGITGWTQVNPWTGAPFGIGCGFDCIIAPGQIKQFTSPQPGLWVDIGFTF